jgi:pimeloyl-ACP methyl ester carboxylesterase
VATPEGGSIYYQAEGSGPPVILLHSGFSHLGMWEETVPALAGRRVIRFDARGHGRTPLGKKPVLGADDLRAVMDALSIDRADLIGSSMGGSVAIDLALIAPERVGRIILAGSAPIGGVPARPEEMQSTLDIFAAMSSGGAGAAAETWAHHPMNAAASPAVRRRLGKLALQSPGVLSVGGFSNFPVTFLQPFAMTRLSQIRHPVLLIIGTRDLPSLRANAKYAAAHLPDARLVEFEEAGHFPSLEEPGRFNQLVVQFLSARRPGW